MTAVGTDQSIVRRVMTTVPTIPFAMPPPGSPTGWGRSISSVQLELLGPLDHQVEEDEEQRQDDEERAEVERPTS